MKLDKDGQNMVSLLQDHTEWKIGDSPYHATPGGRKGVIINIKYWALQRTAEYLVSFGPGELVWCDGTELSQDKIPE